MTLKNNRAPLLSIIKLYASFHHHMWIQTRVTVRKRLSWVLTSVTLTLDLWPRPFAWTSLLSLVIIPENFMMIWWWEHGEKGVTDRRTDGQTDGQTDGLNQSYSCLVAANNYKINNHNKTCTPTWELEYSHCRPCQCDMTAFNISRDTMEMAQWPLCASVYNAGLTIFSPMDITQEQWGCPWLF